MLISHTGFLIIGGLLLVATWARIRTKKAHRDDTRSPMPLELLASLGPMLWLAFIYLGLAYGGAQAYLRVFPDDWKISECQAEYYSIQSVTTTGYGSALTPIEKFQDAKPDDLRMNQCRDRFYRLSSILMLLGTGGFGFLVSGVAAFFVDIRKRVHTGGGLSSGHNHDK